MDSDNATANRMNLEAAGNASPVVQEIADELVETHEGAAVDEVTEAIQDKWTEKFGEDVVPIEESDAAELAEAISAGEDITIVAPEP
jgi:major membrane immunogen (membrane-anchored lipoprotein)